jgi:hypothetical protein
MIQSKIKVAIYTEYALKTNPRISKSQSKTFKFADKTWQKYVLALAQPPAGWAGSFDVELSSKKKSAAFFGMLSTDQSWIILAIQDLATDL